MIGSATTRLLGFALGFLLFLFAIGGAQATTDAALDNALDASVADVKKGFSIREEHWDGKMNVGSKKGIKHQLYKGNEYWFWLGTGLPGVKLSVKIYDSDGRRVDVETKQNKYSAAARILAPKTGRYYIVIEAKPEDPKQKFKKDAVLWALAYGFR